MLDIKEVIKDLQLVNCTNFEFTKLQGAIKAIEQQQAEIERLNKLLIECANFIDPHNDGQGEADRLINIIDKELKK